MPLQVEPKKDSFNQVVANGISDAVDAAVAGKKSSFGLTIRTTDSLADPGKPIQEQEHTFALVAHDGKGGITIGSTVTNYKTDEKDVNTANVGVGSSVVANGAAERDVLKERLTEEALKEAARQLNTYCGSNKECSKETTYSVTVSKYPGTESTFGRAGTTTGDCHSQQLCCCCGDNC
jgi:hypothetical protein